MTFANGQYVAIATHGLFTMHRPKVSDQSQDLIEEDIIHGHVPYDNVPDNFDTLQTLNCIYTVKIDSIYPFYGSTFVTQTLNGRVGNSGNPPNGGVFVDTHNKDALDNMERYHHPEDPGDGSIYVIPDSSDNILEFDDQPEIGCISNTWTHLVFTDYIRFIPDAGPGPNIAVTLGIKTWRNDADTSLQTISGTTNQDYTPPETSTSLDTISCGSASFDALTSDHTLAHWIRTAINHQSNDFP